MEPTLEVRDPREKWPFSGIGRGSAKDRSWPTVPGCGRPLPWRSRAGWSDKRPQLRVITTPASASAGQRQAQRPPRDRPKLLWLDLADVVSAWRESGAGDGNRTHV